MSQSKYWWIWGGGGADLSTPFAKEVLEQLMWNAQVQLSCHATKTGSSFYENVVWPIKYHLIRFLHTFYFIREYREPYE
jgi:hypothetical protein